MHVSPIHHSHHSFLRRFPSLLRPVHSFHHTLFASVSSSIFSICPCVAPNLRYGRNSLCQAGARWISFASATARIFPSRQARRYLLFISHLESHGACILVFCASCSPGHVMQSWARTVSSTISETPSVFHSAILKC